MNLPATTSTNPNKSPESENDTPPPNIQPLNSLSFNPNGTVRKHSATTTHHHQPQHEAVTYKECLKNHAASIGGHALDGCGEYMPCSPAYPSDPTSLKCAACGCHRNFHRRDPDEYSSPYIPAIATNYLDFRRPPPSGRFSSSRSPPPPPPHMLLALSSAAHEDHQPTNNHHHQQQQQIPSPITPTAVKGENPNGRKRFRTKFTSEQKEKMLSFAEKLKWKFQKSDESEIEEFCDEIGVARGVLKVWMHNNKHAFSKKHANIQSDRPIVSEDSSKNEIGNGRVISFENDIGLDDEIKNNNNNNASSSSS